MVRANINFDADAASFGADRTFRSPVGQGLLASASFDDSCTLLNLSRFDLRSAAYHMPTREEEEEEAARCALFAFASRFYIRLYLYPATHSTQRPRKKDLERCDYTITIY